MRKEHLLCALCLTTMTFATDVYSGGVGDALVDLEPLSLLRASSLEIYNHSSQASGGNCGIATPMGSPVASPPLVEPKLPIYKVPGGASFSDPESGDRRSTRLAHGSATRAQ